MKKRLISLMLMLAMAVSLVSVFTGCSTEGNTATEEVTPPMTITIAMIKEEGTTDAGIQAVQDELNKITEKTLNTHVVLQLYTEAEYDAAIKAKIDARLDYRLNNATDLSSKGTDEDKVLNKYGREVTAYPEPYENQIDIFLVNGINNLESYMSYRMAGVSDEDYAEDPAGNSMTVLAPLDSYLTDGTAPLLNKYISATLMNSCIFNDTDAVPQLSAIPSNALYGDSEYLVINKELFDKYAYNVDDVTGLASLEFFLTDIAKNEPDVTPLYNYGSMNLLSVTGRPSAVASYVPDDADPAIAWTPDPITSIIEVRNELTTINSYASIAGKYPVAGSDLDEAVTGEFAAGFISTDTLGIAEYQEDYYTVLTRKSTVSTEQVYNNAFAVFAYTTDAARCMEVIELIQTDREFHNILLYGVENTTYTVDEDTGLVVRKPEGTDGKAYLMDINKCGNLFISLPNTDMNEAELDASANQWEKAKAASRQVSFSPYMGFELVTGDDAEHRQPTEADLDRLEELYYETFEKIADYPNQADPETGELPTFLSYLNEVNTWLLESGSDFLVTRQINTATTSLSVKKQYINWWSEKYPAA